MTKIVRFVYLIQCVNNSMSNDMSMNIIITKWQHLVENNNNWILLFNEKYYSSSCHVFLAYNRDYVE